MANIHNKTNNSRKRGKENEKIKCHICHEEFHLGYLDEHINIYYTTILDTYNYKLHLLLLDTTIQYMYIGIYRQSELPLTGASTYRRSGICYN